MQMDAKGVLKKQVLADKTGTIQYTFTVCISAQALESDPMLSGCKGESDAACRLIEYIRKDSDSFLKKLNVTSYEVNVDGKLIFKLN